jgi:predicted amidophosphoribosyltransferase
MVFLDKSKNKLDVVVCLGEYHPYWNYENGEKTKNPNFDEFSGKILDFKKMDPGAIDEFCKKITGMLTDSIAITVVPSHDPSKAQSGLVMLAKKLAKLKRINAVSCLRRTKKIAKLASGGDRSIQTHLDSIIVVDKNLIKSKDVLLLDDVTTSGNSLQACKQLLLEAGASSVQCLALGKTIRK